MALVIAALALGVLFEGSVGGIESAKVAGQYQQALSRAQSHLAALMTQTGFRAGRQSGNDGGGFHWQTQVIPLAVAPQPGHVAQPELFALRVTVSWQAGGSSRSVTLHSDRLGETALHTQ